MNPKSSLFPKFVALAFTLTLPLIPAIARAADVNWGAAQNITGNADVSTNGNSVGAFNVGSASVPNTTVNGVNFQGFATVGGNGTVGNFTTTSSFSFADNNAAGSTSAPFSNLSPAYQTLLMSRVAMSSTVNLSISGLVIGAQYEFQWWCNSSSDSFGYSTNATGGNNTGDFLSGNVDGAAGGLGQFQLGTFTADATTQSIMFNFVEVGYLNAFQLRQIPRGPVGVPDGGTTLGLLALGVGGLLIVSRKRGVCPA